jgi:uroporphyrinogen-III decarboxylase
MYSKVDRVATLITPSNIHPQLIDKNYDFVRLVSSVEANLELFEKVIERFPNIDAAMPASWLGLAGCGQAEMGTKMKISSMVEPSPEVYALDRISFEDLKLPEMEGFLKTQIELIKAVQSEYPDMNSPPIIEGSFDLAILLRGEKVFDDFRLFKSYQEAPNDVIKEKIAKRGDPFFFTKLMEFTTEASIHLGNMFKQNKVGMLGMVIVNQYANPPIMSPDDFITYIYPYVEKVWKEFKRYRPTAGYMAPSPEEAKKISEYPALSGIACYNNYMFPQNELGITPPEMDEAMILMSKDLKTPYQYLIHGKFLRDGTEKELEAQTRRVCEFAVSNKTPFSVGLAAVPLGTDLKKIDLILNTVEEYGVYK